MQVMLAVLVASALGFSSPHREAAFLSSAPAEEKMGPNMKFSATSTTMQCIISLTFQYFVIYTALGVCRSVLDFQQKKHSESALAKSLKAGAETMFYAPMVCMMFLGFRMRVLQLTKGEGAPQEWVQYAMHAVTYSLLANTLLVMLIPVFTPTSIAVEPTGEMKMEGGNPFENSVLQTTFNVIRYLTVIALYGGFGAVIVGLFLFAPKEGVWDGPVPPVSPAVGCTVALSSTFFMIYLLHAISRTYSQYVAGSTGLTKFEQVMERAADTMGMAPMLCAMFLACRMRALQMDPLHGNPQRWAQNCFWLCTSALIAQTIMAIVVPLFLNGKVEKGRMEGDASITVEDGESYLAKGLSAFRFLIMLCVYVSAIAVVCSAFTIQHPQGKELTPPLSPTMQCVMNLAFQYFLIYGLLWIFITVEDFSSVDLSGAKDAIESAKSTVQFAPMLAVLFIATRMRALAMTDNKGSPQAWVQDGMYLATWSILIQFIMCLVMPLFTGKKFTPDSLDGSTTTKESENVGNVYGAYVVTTVRYFALVALLVGVALVTTGVFTMTPETANGRGSIPLLTDGTLPIDLAPAPVGINDLPGAKTGMEAVGGTVGAGVNAADSAQGAVTGPVADAVSFHKK